MENSKVVVPSQFQRDFIVEGLRTMEVQVLQELAECGAKQQRLQQVSIIKALAKVGVEEWGSRCSMTWRAVFGTAVAVAASENYQSSYEGRLRAEWQTVAAVAASAYHQSSQGLWCEEMWLQGGGVTSCTDGPLLAEAGAGWVWLQADGASRFGSWERALCLQKLELARCGYKLMVPPVSEVGKGPSAC
eukprot:1161746-Pelagomonas_calceolata.AAC.2